MLAAKAAEMKASGLNVISLTIGEPDWDTYENIKEVAIGAIRVGMTKYTPPSGIPELRKAIAAQISDDLNLAFEPADITVSAGCKFVLFACLQVILDPGDEVILAAPFWASYTTMVELAEGRPKIVVCDEQSGFKLTPELLSRAITPKTKAILLNSPSNPTGMLYSKEELLGLAKVLRDHPRVIVISDDIYNRLVFHPDGRVAPHLLHVAPDLRSRVIALNGASKSYAMTGWRLGWAAGPREIITAMSHYQSQSVSCASAISQYAALEAVTNSEPEVEKTRQNLIQRCQFISSELEKIPKLKVHAPQGAFYIWLDVSKYLGRKSRTRPIETTGDMAAALLEEQMVAVVPGVEFGLEGYFRLSFALENSKAKEACDRMKTFFESLST